MINPPLVLSPFIIVGSPGGKSLHMHVYSYELIRCCVFFYRVIRLHLMYSTYGHVQNVLIM